MGYCYHSYIFVILISLYGSLTSGGYYTYRLATDTRIGWQPQWSEISSVREGEREREKGNWECISYLLKPLSVKLDASAKSLSCGDRISTLIMSCTVAHNTSVSLSLSLCVCLPISLSLSLTNEWYQVGLCACVCVIMTEFVCFCFLQIRACMHACMCVSCCVIVSTCRVIGGHLTHNSPHVFPPPCHTIPRHALKLTL